MDCIFCRIVAGTAEATVVREWDDCLAIVPLDPVADGHLLVLPRTHVRDATADPAVTGATATRAAELAAETGGALNLITSVGAEATQSVWHLHVHLVPRQVGDGLPLPWTPQQAESEAIRYTADVVCIRGSQVLAVERGWPPHQGEAALPGGHVDPGETAEQAAVREL